MTETLFPYQEVGAKWLTTKRFALLADEMGLGKTVQAIKACDLLDLSRVLILCPAVARYNWAQEFERFSSKKRSFSLVFNRKHIVPNNSTQSVICSYDLSGVLLNEENRSRLGTFDVLVLDEVHFLKSVDAIRSKMVWGKEGLSRFSKRVWGLSGTPAPNHPGDLWTLLYSFGQTTLSYDAFIERFCTYYLYGGYQRQITGAKEDRIPELKTLLSPIILRRKKEDVMKDLPSIHYGHFDMEPGPYDLSMESGFMQYYFPEDKSKELEKRIKTEKQVMDKVYKQLGSTNELLQALYVMAYNINAIRRVMGLQKVVPLTEIIKQEFKDKAYEKLVIFAIHKDVIEGIRSKLSHLGTVTLYGGMPAYKKQIHISRFQQNRNTRIFIGNIQACGTAINLTVAHNIIFAESTYSPGEMAQCAMRCHRIGQTKPVYVRFANLVNSLDQKINFLLKKKMKQLTKIFDEDRQKIEEEENRRPFQIKMSEE